MVESRDRNGAAPIERPRTVAVVGNAPELSDQGVAIDAADWVVRFNNAAGFGGVAGRRVTHLALVNHGGQMAEWLGDPGFTARPVVRQAGSFLFPFGSKPQDEANVDGDGRDWTAEALARLAPLGRPVAVVPEPVRQEAERLLGIEQGQGGAPSTGFLIALHLLEMLPTTATIDIHGFGFSGWPGHQWERERAWFEDQAARGRLRLHPVDAPAR